MFILEQVIISTRANLSFGLEFLLQDPAQTSPRASGDFLGIYQYGVYKE